MEPVGMEKDMFVHHKTYLAVATLLPAVMEAHTAQPEVERMQLLDAVLNSREPEVKKLDRCY